MGWSRSAYHLDFFVLGICIVVTGVLGIPPCNGLIPQAPLHTKSLGVLRTERLPDGRVVEVVEKTWEPVSYTHLTLPTTPYV